MFRINNAIMEMEKVIIIEEIYWIENHKISTRKIVRISRIFRETGPGSGPDLNFCPVPGPGLQMAGIPESGPGQSGETSDNVEQMNRNIEKHLLVIKEKIFPY